MINSDFLINIFNEYYQIAFLISLLLSILIALSGIIPSVFVTAANIVFFGPTYGFLISLLGEVLGGYISFQVYRLGFKEVVSNNAIKYPLLKNIVSAEGFKCGLYIFEGRLLPFIPSGFVTLAASISNVNSFTYIISTTLGKIPSIALEAIISYDIINISENWSRLIITLLAIVLIIFTNKKLPNFNSKYNLHKEEQSGEPR